MNRVRLKNASFCLKILPTNFNQRYLVYIFMLKKLSSCAIFWMQIRHFWSQMWSKLHIGT